MEKQVRQSRLRLWLTVGAAVIAALLFWRVLRALLVQLGAAYAVMGLALPLCRVLERRLRPGLAAALSMAALGAVAATLVLLIIPPLVGQFTQLSEGLPTLLAQGEALMARVSAYLASRGLDILPMREGLLEQVQTMLAALVTGAASAAQRVFSSLGKVMLAPLFGYYLLRDRKRISAWLTMLVPVPYRARAVRAAREMRRETAGFLRGQLLISASVGALTALGLLLIGLPGWLLLGLVMGVLELVPYVGPLLAGIPAVLTALPGGWTQIAWTLVVIIGVQQLEGGLISPRLMAGAVRLHPLAVLIAISAGGLAAGTPGMLLALPVVVSMRGAIRGARA